jgi:hypothetical protein
MKSKFIKVVAYAIVLASIIGATVLVTKQAEPVQYIKDEPANIDEVIKLQAEQWLQSPEAYEYAKNKVTETLVEELSKQ